MSQEIVSAYEQVEYRGMKALSEEEQDALRSVANDPEELHRLAIVTGCKPERIQAHIAGRVVPADVWSDFFGIFN